MPGRTRKSPTTDGSPATPGPSERKRARIRPETSASPAVTGGGLGRRRSVRNTKCVPCYGAALQESSVEEEASPEVYKRKKKTAVAKKEPSKNARKASTSRRQKEDESSDDEILVSIQKVAHTLINGKSQSAKKVAPEKKTVDKEDSKSGEDDGALRRTSRAPVPRKRLADATDAVAVTNVKEKTPLKVRKPRAASASTSAKTAASTKSEAETSMCSAEAERKKEDLKLKIAGLSRNRKKRVQGIEEIEKEALMVTPRSSSRKSTLRLKASQEKSPPTVQAKTPRNTRTTSRTPVTPAKAQTPAKVKTPAKAKANKTPLKNNESNAKTGPDNKAVEQVKLEWKFNVYGIPKCPLPCREAQFEEIWKFLIENVREKNSGCMYVSGVPGTGKTVIVQAVVDTMQKLNEDKKQNIKFKYLYINGLTLASPDKIWKRMFKGLELQSKSKGISTKEALKRLDSYFESRQRSPVILVVDELDQILDKQQSILYHLLEWSSHATNMFSFVAIFNTMSLPENGLAMRNYSRMGFKRAVFPPYSYEQLQTIVTNMLSTFTTVRLNAEAISLLSRKVAAISGDARRALEIARRPLEIAENGSLTGMLAVGNAFKEIFSSAKIETIKHTSQLEQLILKSITHEIRFSGVEEVLVAKIYESVVSERVFQETGMKCTKDEILKAMMRLAVMRLLIVEDNSTSVHKRVLLKVPVEDVNFALGINTD